MVRGCHIGRHSLEAEVVPWKQTVNPFFQPSEQSERKPGVPGKAYEREGHVSGKMATNKELVAGGSGQRCLRNGRGRAAMPQVGDKCKKTSYSDPLDAGFLPLTVITSVKSQNFSGIADKGTHQHFMRGH